MPAPPWLSGTVRPEEAELAELAPQVARKDVAAVDFAGARSDTVVGEPAHLVAHGIDGFSQAEIEFAIGGTRHLKTPLSSDIESLDNRTVRQFCAQQSGMTMAKIASKIDVRSADFAANDAAMRSLVAELRRTLERNALGGSESARAKHAQAGKLLARERVDALLDPGAPFLELSPLAAQGVYDDDLPGAGIVTGIGKVSGRPCMIVANDPTVKGGTYYPLTVKKHLRAQEIAGENALPCIYLVESGGAFLPKQDEVFPDRDHFGRIFYNQARLSAQGIAQIAVVHGSCTAGGAYVPAMSDHAVIVRNQGRVFLGGPPLVRAATGEEIDAESLGGADVHCRRSGVTDYYAENDLHALAYARRAVARLKPPPLGLAAGGAADPAYDPAEIYGIVPQSSRKPYDVREIIARLVGRILVRRIQGALRRDARVRLRRHSRHAGRHPRQQRHSVLGERREGRAFHRALLPRGDSAGVPAEYLRVHGGTGGRGGRYRQGRRQARDRGGVRCGAEVHGHHRRQLRRGQLRHVRPRLRSASPVSVAERAHLGDGRRTGRERARHHQARCR